MTVLGRGVRLARWLLARAYAPPAADEILAELTELAAYRRAADGPLSAGARFWADVARHLVRGALVEPLRADRRPSPGSGWFHDLRHAARKLRRGPVHAAVTVGTLGLAIAAVTAVFSLVNLLMFAPLPFDEPGELLLLRDVISRPGQPPVEYTPRARTLQAVREVLPDLEAVGHRFGTVRVAGEGGPTLAVGVEVTDGWFETVGVRPRFGRSFSVREQRAGRGANAVIIGHDLWHRALEADPEIVGRTLLLDDDPHLVVGIMAAGFAFPWGAELWIQGELDPTIATSYGTVARRPGGADDGRLRALLADASERMRETYPEAFAESRLGYESLRDYLVGNRDRIAWMLLAAVLLLLVLACTNIAGLALVRVLGHESELAVRAALGSGRGRLFRLVFLEGLLLAVLGGIAGVGLAQLFQHRLGALAGGSQSGVGLLLDLRLDFRVLGFVALVTGAAAVLASTLPAVRAVTAGRSAALTHGRTGASRATGRLLSGVLVAQAATCVVLLMGSAAVGRAYLDLETTTRGYETEDRSVVRVVLPEDRYPAGVGRAEYLSELTRRLAERPEVLSAGFTHHLPMTAGDWTRVFTFEQLSEGEEIGGGVNARWVSSDYFAAMGLELLAGRTFTEVEMQRAAPVTVISADVARRFGESPTALIGGRIKMGTREEDSPWREIVGVVEQAREEWGLPETIYLPYPDQPHAWVEMVVHTRPGTAERQLSAVLRGIDPDQPVDDIRSLSALQSGELRAERLSAAIVSALAAGGLAITLLGTWGLVAFRVRQRRRELGIRMALGCDSPRLVWHVVSRGVTLVAGGALLAAVATVAIVIPLFGAAEVASDLPELQLLVGGLRVDPATAAIVLGLVLATTVLACLVPVLRAIAADPLQVLHDR